MVAFCSPGLSYSNSMGWLLEEEELLDPLGHNNNNKQNQNYIYESERSDTPLSMDSPNIKKLNHNASERDRRKKINNLIYTLRSLLPGEDDHTKKMSIPATIGRVLKYIPELQKQVKGLTKKKEELLSRISRQGKNAVLDKQYSHSHRQRKNNINLNYNSSDFVVSTSKLNHSEVAIHISSYELHKTLLSEILLSLQNNGLLLLNASSSNTFGGMLFYTLHYQVKEIQRLESEILIQKLLSIYENKRRNQHYSFC